MLLDSEVEVTFPMTENYGQLFQETEGTYVLRGPQIDFGSYDHGTDAKAIHDYKIAIIPISLDMSSKSSFDELKKIIIDKWY